MSKNKKNNYGMYFLVIGSIFLVLSLFVNRFIEVSDLICIFLMIASLGIEFVGLFKIVKETYR